MKNLTKLKNIEVKNGKIIDIDIDFFVNRKISDLIEYLVKIEKTSKFEEYFILMDDENNYYRDSDPRYIYVAHRDETDEEFQKRVDDLKKDAQLKKQKAKKEKQEKLEAERKEYERLKQKFEK